MNHQDYLDGKISFETYYKGLAKEHHIAITDVTLFGVKSLVDLKLKYSADKNLNNIPLRIFDRVTTSYNFHNPHNRLTLADGCCIYKTLLIEMVKEK